MHENFNAHEVLLGGPMATLAVSSVRRHARNRLRRRGYTKEQAERLVASVDDGDILTKLQEFWKKWGPTIMAVLKVVLTILPLLMAAEAPKNSPPKGADLEALIAEEEAEANEEHP